MKTNIAKEELNELKKCEYIFIDIDDSLRDSNKKITDRTKNIIRKMMDAGKNIVLCTGRPRKYAQRVCEECGASQYIINSEGANIYDCKKNVSMYNGYVNNNMCVYIYNIAMENECGCIYNTVDEEYINKFQKAREIEKQIPKDIEKFIDDNENILSIMLTNVDFEKIKEIKEILEQLKEISIKDVHKGFYDSSLIEDEIWIEINDAKVSKGNAIKEFCNIKKIDTNNVIAIGDYYNDISMFEAVGHSVVMGNAYEEVKKHADIEIGSNDEEGVAEFLEMLSNN